ncbi:MAG: exodeoxyribonuclease V subunit gamma [Planctomycetes bacterium]|jgi:ATP-dependent helicase/nuclease subunit B|nr:exodeoxyribonuclease V subunit gamma [Planctomycetota bacterium]
MAVQFVLGRSGTGKTSYCVRALVTALLETSEQPLLFLVPEQATYQAERAILSEGRIRGYHRLHILSFDRLQFMLLGKNIARPTLSRIGRQMIVHKILRDNLDKLRIFGSSALLPGFAREMADTITELHQYARNAAEVDTLVEYLSKKAAGRRPEAGGKPLPPAAYSLQPAGGNPQAALKFADISLVFRCYTEALEDKFIDPDAQIVSACRAVAQADFIRGARLWVDGFASFTGGEMALLMELLKTVDHAHMALCLDPAQCDVPGGIVKAAGLGDGAVVPRGSHRQAALDDATRRNSPDQVGLFEPTARTYRDMLERLAEAKVKVGKPVILRRAERFRDCAALAHVEQSVFHLGARKSKADGAVRLVAAPSLRLEIQTVARQILGLVREKGYRYRDVAVVASDLSHYEQYVRAYFEDCGIPFFIDKRKPLNQHPVVELVCAALQAVTGGLTHADVFAYLKTDLVPTKRADVDRLENYCLAFGVDGRDWASAKPWRFQGPQEEDFDEDRINRIRGEASGPLLEMRQALCPEGDLRKRLTSREFTRVLFAFLDRLHIRTTLSQWIAEAQQSGALTTADEHRQCFDTFVDIFDALVEIFADEEMTAPDYFGLLASAFSQMTLAFIPPSLDQVLVGSIERSRHPNLKAIFLLGATQRQFPIPLASSGVLTDDDREAAEGAEFHLAPSSTQSLVDRQYLAYIAFTRPSQFLCISYPCVDEKGSPIMRSHFIDELQSLFEDVPEEFVADDRLTLADIRNPAELGELLCSRLGRDASSMGGPPRSSTGILPVNTPDDHGPDARAASDDELAGLLRAMQADDEFKPLAQRMVLALGYENRAVLDPAVVKELFGRHLRASATRLAAFAACPYRHFVKYVLDLRPRREFKLQPLDLGLFYHRVLDSLQKRLTEQNESLADIEKDRLLELVREQIAALVGQDSFLAQFMHRSAHNAFIIESAGRILEECVLGLCQMVRAGSFRPVLTEVGFGRPLDVAGKLGHFELPLPEGRVLSLDGKIDRLDVARIDGRKVALIFDYKRTRGSARFKWSDFYHGLDVQLAIYMLAVHHGGAGVADEVAGAVYLPIETTASSATLADLAEEEAGKFPYKADGIINSAYCHHLDAHACGQSVYYNFYTKKDGDPCGMYARTNALTPGHFARMLDWARDSLVRLAIDILSGRIECKPYHRGSERGCANCDYMAVCHFDWQINDYNFLPPAGKSDLIARLDSA